VGRGSAPAFLDYYETIEVRQNFQHCRIMKAPLRVASLKIPANEQPGMHSHVSSLQRCYKADRTMTSQLEERRQYRGGVRDQV